MTILTQEEKRALKDRERLLYTSGQFPLFNPGKGPRSGLSRVATVAAALVLALLAIAVLLGVSG